MRASVEQFAATQLGTRMTNTETEIVAHARQDLG